MAELMVRELEGAYDLPDQYADYEEDIMDDVLTTDLEVAAAIERESRWAKGMPFS